MKPTEGTILTVSRLAAAAACDACADGGDEYPIESMLIAAYEAANIALADTINQNPVLKKAGVIDSGGKGYVYILEAMIAAVKGEKYEFSGTVESKERANFSDFSDEDITFGYCTEFIVTRTNKKDPERLKAFLNALGDSIVVVADDELIKVHVHTDAPGNVLTEALTYGSLLTVKIENMREQHTEQLKAESEAEPAVAAIEKPIGVVAVCAGSGLTEVFTNLGADRVVSGGQTMNPSTEDILREINKVPASTVFVLPNNSNIVMTANQCVGAASGRKVIVIPTTSVPQGVAALLALEPDTEPEEITANMNEVISRVRTISVTKAARDSIFDGASINEGDAMAMLEGKLLAYSSGFPELTPAILKSIREFTPEFLTLYYGEDADSDDVAALESAIVVEFPDAEVTVVSGGQPVYDFIISVE
jgi:DAK2 domain fusion protein YloV